MAQGTKVTPSSPVTTSSRRHSTCEIREFRAKYRESEEKQSKIMPALRTCAGPGSIHSNLCLSACPTFSCLGIYIIEEKSLRYPASNHLQWCVEASQAYGSSSEVPRLDGGRARRDQDPVRTARGAQVSERNSSRTGEVIGPVCRLPHLLDLSRGLTSVRKEIVNSTAPGTPRSGREGINSWDREETGRYFCEAEAQRPSPKPPGTRALPVLCWAFRETDTGKGMVAIKPRRSVICSSPG